MDRWANKIAVVTGASAGIGLCLVKHLIDCDIIVIGLARRLDRMEELKSELGEKRVNFHPVKCDISKLDSIKVAFINIQQSFGRVHILINNAGVMKSCNILDSGNEADLSDIIAINLIGSIHCVKEMFKIMKECGEECHIININSTLGHTIPFIPSVSLSHNLYPSSKYALRAATEVLRQELCENKNFRISSISPGLVKTEICHSAGHPYADRIMNSRAILLPEDVAKTVIFVLGTPKHVQIAEIIILPVGQKY